MKRNQDSVKMIIFAGNLLVTLSMALSSAFISPSRMALPRSENSYPGKPFLAQEEQPTEEPTETIPAETPTEEPVPSPTLEPTLEPSPTDVILPTPTSEPPIEITPTQEPTPTAELTETNSSLVLLDFNENQQTSVTEIISDNPDPSVVNQPYTVSVIVSGSFSIPNGSIDINDGEGASCTATLAEGAGSCSLTSTSSGGKTLSATYSGDETYATSNDTEAHTVNKNTSMTLITNDDPDPNQVGKSFTVGVTVSGSVGTPTGTVTIDDGDGADCIATLVNGSGSCDINSTSSGEKILTANYSSDGTYATSSDTETHTVNDAPNRDSYEEDGTCGQAKLISPEEQQMRNIIPGRESDWVMFTLPQAGDVTLETSGPSGDTIMYLYMSDCITQIAQDDDSGAGFFSLITQGGLAAGTYYVSIVSYHNTEIDLYYLNYSPSILQLESTTSITSDAPDPSLVNQSYTVGVTVSGSTGTPTGNVNIDDGAGTSCTATLFSGSGFCALTSKVSGNMELTANYSGNGTYAASSDTVEHTVNKYASSTTITSDAPDPSLANQSYTVGVTVSGSAGTPRGTVDIDDGAGASCTAILVSGSGSCALTSTASGSKTLTANYSGNVTYSASSDTEAHAVNKNTSTTTITNDNPDPSVEGQNYTVAVTVSGSAGTPTGSVSVNDGEGSGCTISSLSGGSGSCSMSSSSVGLKTLTSTYSGNEAYSSSSKTESHTVLVAVFPEIDVKGNNISITNGDSTPGLSDNTYFGAVPVASGTLTRTFTIYNTGNGDLNLSGNPKVMLSGTNAADFSVSSQPASLVVPAGLTSFTVVCDPSSPGLRTATLSIANDDRNEHPYTFDIQCAGTVTLTPQKPAAPLLVSPLSASATNDSTPAFTWNSVPYGVTYQIQVSRSSTFTIVADSHSGSDLSFTPSASLADAKYYWRVRAANSINVFSYWSTVRSVSIDTAPPPAPALSFPAANAAVIGTPTFAWLAAAGANAYQFEYDDDPGFGSPNYTSPVLKTLTHKPPPMALGTFFWRVRSRDAAGNWSESWSAARMITISFL